MTTVANINEVLEGHVVLEVECVDRMLLNAYVPTCRCKLRRRLRTIARHR